MAKALINGTGQPEEAVENRGGFLREYLHGASGNNSIHRWSPDGAKHAVFAGPFSDSPEQILATVHTTMVG